MKKYKLVICEIPEDLGTVSVFFCANCGEALYDGRFADYSDCEPVFLCPSCHHFFSGNGLLSFFEACKLFGYISPYPY